MALLPVEEAKARLFSRAHPLQSTERLPLHEAKGRILACGLAARLTQPPFDASAMDGYALAVSGAVPVEKEFTVIGTAAAGHAFDGRVGTGEAVRIFTGAPMPDGADAVLIQEDAQTVGKNRIHAKTDIVRGKHIRSKGQDFMAGETILAAGTQLDFAQLTIAAAMNHAEVDVLRRPLVAILATGDELLPPGYEPGPAQIIASNTFGISALVRDNGGDVLDLGIARDRKGDIADAIARAKAAKADVLVTIGGASVGDHDLVQSTLKDAGMELDFWRIAMRPGKPLMVGDLDGMHVLGLPGNPVASLVTGLLFLEPLVRKLAGLPHREREVQGVTARPLAANDRRQDYLRARISKNQRERFIAEAFEKQDSSMMKVFARSDGLIIRPPHAPELPAGASCPILLIRP